MKNLKKLTKKALKEINGGAGNKCIIKCFCFDPSGEIRTGTCTMKGDCC
ncbi:bacteriocin [uncultured Chryseobacterium sp.]|nr:bacteriocin [uncultured Chryseobacterium sp.]